MRVAIVGAGRLAQSLVPALKQAGHTISEIISRPASLPRARKLAKKAGAIALTARQTRLPADLVWFCVPDGKISAAAQALAHLQWKGKYAFHSSGALSSEALEILRKRGAAIASVHPLMTFASPTTPDLGEVPFALEGTRAATALARKIGRSLGGEPFAIRQQDKALYHAWGTFASPLLIALLATAEQVAKASGTPVEAARKKMLPILRQTLNNYAAQGPARSFTGPIVRGDSEILARHLQALKAIPQAQQVYRALARSALKYLPVKKRKQSAALLGI